MSNLTEEITENTEEMKIKSKKIRTEKQMAALNLAREKAFEKRKQKAELKAKQNQEQEPEPVPEPKLEPEP
jgi:hypothetical protein